MTIIGNAENSRWRTADILKIVIFLYLSCESSDFNEIWLSDSNHSQVMKKNQNFAHLKWWTASATHVFGNI